MSTMMLIIVTISFVAMLTVNILFARGKKLNTMVVICLIAAFAFAAVAAATGVFAAFGAIATDAVAKSAAEAVTDASGYFIVSALAACFAACFATVLAGVKEVKNHILVSLGFYVFLGTSVYLFLVGSSFVF